MTLPSSRGFGVSASLSGALLLCAILVEAQESTQQPPAQPHIESLGGERYRVGEIVIDKAAGSFLVPGRILTIDVPLEYLAVIVRGPKGYESLLELDASAVEFNLACILIGLTNDAAVPPDFQFDLDEVVGPSVTITAQWEENGETVEVDAGLLVMSDGKPGIPDDWVYFGSSHPPGHPDVFLASSVGTLIGLAHDPASIIEHRTGVGIGARGSIVGNAELLGEIGKALTLRIAAKR